MFVCLCNALRDKEINRAIEGGASCLEEVYGCFGCKPQCGQCIPHIEDKLFDSEDARNGKHAS